MRRMLLTGLAPILLALAVCLPAGRAHGQDKVTIERGVQGGRNETKEEEARVPALQYTLAFMFSMLVLTIVCMPSRKAAYG